MKNLTCQCESPSIILNPHLKDIVLKYKHFYIRGFLHQLTPWQCSRWFEEFPYSMFGSIKRQICRTDELDGYYIIDEFGEQIPLFIEVPCGKCILCREHKSQEWVSRAMCETQTSTNVPYFITLTYNNLHTPKNGVRKRDSQLFLKRLRVNLSRYVDHEVNIRFFLCAEYGSNTKRPHYHALLWNLPKIDPKKLLDIIENSWSFMVSKKRYNELPNDVDTFGKYIYKYHDKVNKRYRARFGYVMMSECNEKRVRYCMKYMRKASEIPNGCNDVFYLSSRRRGLGFDWISQHVNEFRDNPQLLDIKLTDKFTGESFSGCIPRYFKDIICPPTSKLIPKDIRDKWKYYNWLHNKACSLIGYSYIPSPRLLEHFPTLYYHSCRLSHVATEELHLHPELHNQLVHDDYTRELFRLCDALEWDMLQCEYDVDLAQYVPTYKKLHMEAVECYAARNTESIPDKVSKVRRRLVRQKNRERL